MLCEEWIMEERRVSRYSRQEARSGVQVRNNDGGDRGATA